jgi:hypothetical protein
MWAAETNSGDLAMLRVHLSRFSDGRDSAPAESYKGLPKPGGYALQNRFVGEYLLYGAGAGWRRPQNVTESEVFAVKYSGGYTYAIPLVHGVDRIEALGANAVVVGSDGTDLHFTSVRLANHPVARDRYTRHNAAQGETRSHGFFYKPETEYDGLVGLPIIGGGQAAGRNLRHESASLLYLRNQSLSLSELGTLDSRPANSNDACRASCVDWYGNSRPLFVRKRVFALMGYEIVEGRVSDNRIAEVRRVNYAPQSADYAMIFEVGSAGFDRYGPLLARPVAHLQQPAVVQPDVAEHAVAAVRELIQGSGFPQGFLLAPPPGRQSRVGPAHHVAEHSSAHRTRPPDIGSVVSARKHGDLLEVAVSNRKRRQLRRSTYAPDFTPETVGIGWYPGRGIGHGDAVTRPKQSRNPGEIACEGAPTTIASP